VKPIGIILNGKTKSEVFRGFAFHFTSLLSKSHCHLKIGFFVTACLHSDEAVIEDVRLHPHDFLIQQFKGCVMTAIDYLSDNEQR